ncbi:MAG: TonB-dependent receptor [Sphingobacteriaceae bacterium]|nr:TonB-dependent receptor [Sphingobacteriaceae bacterium]MBK7817620.1 TonB-dependent receptor [Sphingobacteriaceae bacterium]
MKRTKTFLFVLLSTAFAIQLSGQNKFTGTVKNEEGEPISFAALGIKKGYASAISNAEGQFTIDDFPKGQQVVEVRSIGYHTILDTVEANGDLNKEYTLVIDNKTLDEVVIQSTRAGKFSGMAYSEMSKEDIAKNNLGKDAPILLDQMASVVVNSDAGNGVGYTGLWIRGTDGTRINVTINGVPVNDAESQGTFFVNMPDFMSSVNSVQVQRGVGASSNGAGAFGASINFQTNALNEKAYGQVMSSVGSYNTFKNTLAVGSGLINGKFSMDARASKISSNGYIDRAKSNLGSLYFSAGYYGKKDVLKFIAFTGKERTYQAWYYVPTDSLGRGNRTFNPAGIYFDANGNIQYYNNETDNYQQDNYQLHYTRSINSKLNFNLTGHYTKGRGYYEQYKQGESLTSYNMNDVITAKGDTITSTDLIRRLWLDNDFVGVLGNVSYKASNKLSLVLGGGYNDYYGRHFGRVMWAQFASNATIDHEYYKYTASKTDANVYLKLNYNPINDLFVFIDLQQRMINYSFLGFDDSLKSTKQQEALSFFNPKVGVSYRLNSALSVYGSFAIGNKEPNRNDYVNSTPKSRPKNENLKDVELGARYTSNKYSVQVNIFNMDYTDQLVLSGKVNDVGAYTRVNVEKSVRRGVELEFAYAPSKYVTLTGNLTLSQNKIKEFNEYTDDYDNGGQILATYKNTDISFSPNTISSLVLAFKPINGLEIALINKYVDRQFLDNTAKKERSINPYNYNDVRFNYTYKFKNSTELSLMLTLSNIFNTVYETNGYTYGYYYGNQLNTYNYLAPAAPLHCMGGISLKF